MTRKLVTIKTITDIQPIPDADAIEVATVDHGWKVVVKKEDNYQINDKVLYLEVDSWVPHKIAPFLSRGQEPREYNGVKGERLRSIRLKKQISQGLILKFGKQNPAHSSPWRMDDGVVTFSSNIINDDLTFIHSDTEEHLAEVLNVQKWEAPVPAQLRGNVKGNFPSWIPKTDEPRIQNMFEELGELQQYEYEVTEKLEGTSATFYSFNGTFGVCSRNWDLYESEENTYWQMAKKYNLKNLFEKVNKNIAIQAEIVGPGIQKNYYKLKEHQVFVFNIYDIDSSRYFTPKDRKKFCELYDLSHVPNLGKMSIKNKNISDLIVMSDGISQLNDNVYREGIVFKSICSANHFKSISNQFLLKSGG